MAIIYTYPTATPTGSDNILGSRLNPVTEEQETVQFGIQAVSALSTNNYIEETFTLTNAQLTALQGTDVQLLAQPGANKVLKVLEVSVYLDFNTAAFTFAQPLLIQYKDDGSGSPGTIATIPVAFAQLATDAVYMAQPASARAGINEAILISTSGAVGAGGNTSMKIKIRYQELDVTSF